MVGRAVPSFTLLLLVIGASSPALADNESIAVGEPSPQGEQQVERPSLPKLLGYGKGEDGTHAFLFGRKDGPPIVFIGQPGALEELDVLGMERGSGKFLVDTLELGDIVFDTTDRSVIIPGDVGFIQKRPTRVMRGKPDKAVFEEAMARMGFVRTPAQLHVPPSSGTVRMLPRPRSLTAVASHGRPHILQQSAHQRHTMRVRSVRRPTARTKSTVTGRSRVRTTGRAAAR